MINFGPIIFGLIIGLIIGFAMKDNPKSKINFTVSSFIVILIVAIVIAWQLGNFPYYEDFPVATGFISGAVGIIIGKVITNANNNYR
jgi:energy-converting hydrogenase B subunit J